MSNCEGMRTAMHARLDGELSASEDQTLAAHLVACAACRTRFEELRTVDALLGEIGLTDRPSTDRAAAEQAVRGQTAKDRPEPRIVPIPPAVAPAASHRIAAKTWPALAASVLLATVLFLTLTTTPEPTLPVAVRDEPFSASFDEEELLAVTVPTENPQIKIVWLYTAHKDTPKGL